MDNEEIMDGEGQITEDHLGPGALLRKAREEKNFSQADIAKQLKLSLQWIKDLESDNYTYAPAAIYVRGHLRSYARLVDISPDAVIEASKNCLEAQCGKTKYHEKKANLQLNISPVVKSRASSVNRKTLRWMSMLVLLVLVMLVALWWSGKRKHGVDSTQSSLITQSSGTPIQLQGAVGKMRLSGTDRKQR